MPLISAELMEKTWRRVGAFDGRDVRRMQKTHRKAQSTLTLFVYGKMPGVREEAVGVLIYVYHVVLEAFLRTNARPKRVSRSQIESVVSDIESGHQPSTYVVDEGSISEPHAVRYVIEAFTEGDDPVLTTQEVESFFQTLWVAIECLHKACTEK